MTTPLDLSVPHLARVLVTMIDGLENEAMECGTLEKREAGYGAYDRAFLYAGRKHLADVFLRRLWSALVGEEVWRDGLPTAGQVRDILAAVAEDI